MALKVMVCAAFGRFTVRVYVLVLPSCAVTIVLITLSPIFSVKLPEAEPDITVVLLTLIVALAWSRLGVTVMEVVAFVTDAV